MRHRNVQDLGHRLGASDGGDPWELSVELSAATGEWRVTGALIIGGVAAAGASAYGARQQAQAANRSRNGYTDQTTTQNPYRGNDINHDIDNVLNFQRGMMQRGSPQVDARGNVYYQTLPGYGSQYSSTPTDAAGNPYNPAAAAAPAGGGGGGARPAAARTGGGGGGTYGGYTSAQLQADPSLINKLGATARQKWERDRTGAAPTTGPVTSTPPGGSNLSTPQGVFTAVAQRGLDAGNTQTQSQARNMMSNVWGDAARSGSANGTEYSGFEGYNPILDRLTYNLEDDVNSRSGQDLLLNFLNENGRGGGGGAPQAGSQPVQYNAQGQRVATGGYFGSGYTTAAPAEGGGNGTPPARGSGAYGAGASGWSGGGGYQGSGVPDTVGGNNSFFAQQTQKMFDEKSNDAELQALIDAMNQDVEKGMYRDLAQLDASAQGSGRFGGGMWKALAGDAREQAAGEMTEGAARVRVGDREARRQALLNALSQVNTRDLGLLGANVQREGIAASERNASAGASAASAGLAEQSALARRAQDLSAIGALMDNERFSLGQLGDLGGQLSSDRLSSLGMVPGLEGIGLQGLQSALGAGGGMTDLRGQDIQRQIANQQASTARAGLNLQRQGMNQQLGMYNASQQQGAVNDYLRTILSIGGLGGTSTTTGTNVQPGLGVNPTGAALQGALGGASTAAGIYLQGRQAGAW
jgi:hypothetical protein